MRPYELIYCDKDLIVVNKAPGVPCHPLEKIQKEGVSLIEAVAHEFSEVISQFLGDREGGLCHRIDNDTSGVVVIARHPKTRDRMRALFHEGKIEKSYVAIVKGKVQNSGEIRFPIAHHEKNARKMIALTSLTLRHRGHPKEAYTSFKVLLNNGASSLLRIRIGAGRRHQIRVHMASVGHPLIGDTLYGGPRAAHMSGHALHASTIVLPDGRELEAHAPSLWDDELKALGLTK